ncbi:MAG: hypothetical protein GY851_34145 [bacterium]|nr:hypothetical protein [bacterium]
MNRVKLHCRPVSSVRRPVRAQTVLELKKDAMLEVMEGGTGFFDNFLGSAVANIGTIGTTIFGAIDSTWSSWQFGSKRSPGDA